MSAETDLFGRSLSKSDPLYCPNCGSVDLMESARPGQNGLTRFGLNCAICCFEIASHNKGATASFCRALSRWRAGLTVVRMMTRAERKRAEASRHSWGDLA